MPKNDSDFTKEKIRLPDGRELIYYDFNHETLPENSVKRSIKQTVIDEK